ncbi:integrase core domain-containing protein, partial [Candidatus Acetothermia bacterium]|nr:integrase core domain-containing protein [Candidatus Acetothermia bacterium]
TSGQRRFIPFQEICHQHKIKHRTIKFNHPWTNGMVERFNRSAGEQVLTKYHFCSIFEMNCNDLSLSIVTISKRD